MLAELQRWRDARRQAHGPHAALFATYRGQEWVAIDCEATGLDPRRDALLSLAAVPVAGTTIRLRDRLCLKIGYQGADLQRAIRHHRLRAADLADGLPLQAALCQLMDMLGNRPLVGYCIGFDRILLGRALRQTLGFGLPQRCIDVRSEFARWWRRRHPAQTPDLRLEAMATTLRVPLFQRHDALGDALTAAAIRLALSAATG
jgi:DNA polymerase-3 subunit epsilon